MSAHTNYSRQYCQWWLSHAETMRSLRRLNPAEYERIVPPGSTEEEELTRQQALVSRLQRSVKVLLPPNGVVLDDSSLRALRPEMPLHLPFPLVALEYEQREETCAGVFGRRGPRIILCEETAEEIEISFGEKAEGTKLWHMFPLYSVKRKGWFTENNGKWPGYGGVFLRASVGGGRVSPIPATDSRLGPLNVVMDFLNALACTNVAVVDSRSNSSGKVRHGALPFDCYKVLTVLAPHSATRGDGVFGGDRRQTREHLRRGHIRRLPSGGCVWVNAHVVNAGVGGRVEKDYALKSVAPRSSPVAQLAPAVTR